MCDDSYKDCLINFKEEFCNFLEKHNYYEN